MFNFLIMRQKTEANDYTPILHKNSSSKLPPYKCSKIKLFFLLTVVLLVVATVCLYDAKLLKNENSKSGLTQLSYINNNYCQLTPNDYKFDCFPRGKGDQKSCEERNCCWSPSTPNSQTPWCYYPSNYSNYKVINVTKTRDEIISYFNLTKYTNYKNDIKILRMDISFQTAQRLRIKVIT